ncbi:MULTISPECIES: protein translocase subunit SecF [unclassified Campylobacter]|uniref:protein translocase subunit SecF n=1 Tax=unclassified Campylobacter TaxID=2593542 RepID=UPI0022E9DA93|nr:MULTISPECIES: protein translocase subunit SecF [unclassified Campylobacter]MDA3042770.1 protein translocase subunit SecF [Campylobacter sp. JMF_09 ED2]MDA3044395.1 protein translocase subunit SecF [Campylobacter sp. JMF_07 ED4]MDA3063741.1 protein translocase subunit SecF [Campylobacter sp. JMF_11 EL3]MDA3071370.1 protein translocase subunit SecF [Campylobacter sp. VBCF_03 NA9]MDA3074830.1 protein translocase subunit SecF [Campylobacter sp. JMF_05 ED3]
MQVFDSDKIYDFMKFRHIAFVISAILIIGSIGLFLIKGFNYGIDFSGGTLIQVKYDTKAPLDEIRTRFEAANLGNINVTEFGSEEEVTIRYSGSSDSLGDNPALAAQEILKGSGNFEVRKVDVVGPKVGSELRTKGIMALCVSFALILVYITIRFEWRFAIAAVISDLHDVIIACGALILFKIDFNLEILAALLTIMGYSLNDTIVVFDRIREGVRTSKSIKLTEVINESISATLSRTFLTSFTTLLVIVILFVWGGAMIHGFSLVMLVGVVAGTFSSVFIAAPLLILFGFDVEKYRAFLADKQRRAKEKEKMRAMYEKGTV